MVANGDSTSGMEIVKRIETGTFLNFYGALRSGEANDQFLVRVVKKGLIDHPLALAAAAATHEQRWEYKEALDLREKIANAFCKSGKEEDLEIAAYNLQQAARNCEGLGQPKSASNFHSRVLALPLENRLYLDTSNSELTRIGHKESETDILSRDPSRWEEKYRQQKLEMEKNLYIQTNKKSFEDRYFTNIEHILEFATGIDIIQRQGEMAFSRFLIMEQQCEEAIQILLGKKEPEFKFSSEPFESGHIKAAKRFVEKGNLSLGDGDFSKAVEWYKMALARYQNAVVSLEEHSLLHAAEEKAREAGSAYQRFLIGYPIDDAIKLYTESFAHFDNAISELLGNGKLTFDPDWRDHTISKLFLSKAVAKKQAYEIRKRQIEALTSAKEAVPELLYKELKEKENWSEDNREAGSWYDKIIRRHEQRAELHIKKSKSLYGEGKLFEAAEARKRANEFYGKAGDLYLERGNPVKAILSFEKAGNHEKAAMMGVKHNLLGTAELNFLMSGDFYNAGKVCKHDQANLYQRIAEILGQVPKQS
ncbi:hypothetical protein HY638_04775 [Candidatus Woesearchaeota archaeon]|nr:hypothetical protein [Candidatus Woesearchaeota archaeon]